MISLTTEDYAFLFLERTVSLVYLKGTMFLVKQPTSIKFGLFFQKEELFSCVLERNGCFWCETTNQYKIWPFFFRKKNCSSCISERNECFWCETSKTCFPFNHYSSHFIHGKCQDWVDFEGKQIHYCLDCSTLPNCTSCLERFGCGWCGDSNNPKIGKCVGGGFPGKCSLAELVIILRPEYCAELFVWLAVKQGRRQLYGALIHVFVKNYHRRCNYMY